jgi:hypothetical protein
VASLGEYPEAMRAVAREERVALIDLAPRSVRFYEQLGPDGASRAFADDGRDKTHHNEFGARALAGLVIEGLRAADGVLTAGLARHLADADHADRLAPDAVKPAVFIGARFEKGLWRVAVPAKSIVVLSEAGK